MSDAAYLVFTAVAALALAFALLQVMTKWLAVDGQSIAIEAQLQRKLSGDSSTSEPLISTPTTKLGPFIARHQLAYGGAAIALCTAFGWFVGGSDGAFKGASVGAVIGVLAGTAAAALKHGKR